jgi:hypothetical protein
MTSGNNGGDANWIGIYNHERLHESLGGIPPVEHEALLDQRGRPAGALVTDFEDLP